MGSVRQWQRSTTLQIAESLLQSCKRRNRRSLSAQNPGPQAHFHKVSRERSFPLLWREAAFRSDQQDDAPRGVDGAQAHAAPRRQQQAQVPIGWVVADTVYGGNLDLRSWCEQQQYPYVLAVPCDEPIGIVAPLAPGSAR